MTNKPAGMEEFTVKIEPRTAQLESSLPSPAAASRNTLISTLYVTNIHCQSCVSYANDVLLPISSDVLDVEISIANHSIRVEHRQLDTAFAITKELSEAAFEVQHVETHDQDVLVWENDPQPSPRRASWHNTLSMSRAQRRHIDNCNACKSERIQKKEKSRTGGRRNLAALKRPRNEQNLVHSESSVSSEKPAVIGVDGLTFSFPEKAPADGTPGGSDAFRALISIGGMTCASCVGAITKELETMDIVRSVTVNLVANNASIQFDGPRGNVERIVEAIEDIGYEATLGEVHTATKNSRLPETNTRAFRLSLSIEGMTCGSCVGTITRGLEELPFVSSINIDLVGCSGIVEFEDKENLAQILEKIDDLGYDATSVSLEGKDALLKTDGRPSERTVTISIDGMFCEHCPERVMKACLEAGGESIQITQQLTLKDPRLTVTYAPSALSVTARRLISVIESTHEAFSAKIDRAPSIEERSRAIQHREQRHILLRLLFTFMVAIPTFIIGIVYMSLVPSANKTRIWFEEPVWAGSASRTEWALFIMTTPVMFFGADVFHVRAYKELRALWRPGSKVPIVRRFYRFGSMNLLISAGTCVAYFSSVAVLALDASSDPNQAKSHGNNTYFDSVTFLTFFILIGKFIEAYSKAKTGDAVAALGSLRPSEALLVEPTNNLTKNRTVSINPISLATGTKINPEELVSEEHTELGITTRIPVDLLEIGDIVNVPHGTSPPTDGTISQDGTFLFDESSLTGESKAVKKLLGDKVFAGSVNLAHPVRIIVTDIGGTSMLDQIVAVVREGQTKRAPIERIADTITGYFVPVITLIAIITFVTWLALGLSGSLPRSWLDVDQGGWAFWAVEFAISVFVVACPCGIALAAPTALFVGGGLAAKRGILVQGGGEAFQEASKLDVIVFDKTGTLTEGKMKVTDCEILAGEKEQKDDDLAVAFALAKILEESSNHPIAKAIVEYCGERQKQSGGSVRVLTAEIEEVSGQGMKGTFSLQYLTPGKGEVVMHYEAGIGNQRLSSTMRDEVGPSMHDSTSTKAFECFLDPVLGKFQNLGHSTAVLTLRRKFGLDAQKSPGDLAFHQLEPLLVFAISDPLRPTTASVLQTLQSQYNIAVHMCTGDNPTTAQAIAAQLSIPVSRVRAGVLPQDKAAYIHELQHPSPSDTSFHPRRRIVAFVGDGTNDAAALAAADVSVALSSGSDVAINSASFILLNSDLETVLELVRLAKRVFWRVKANFVWAAVYNVALVPVAAGVFYALGGHWRLGPVWSSAAMAASSVSVVTSSLALRLPEVRFRWGRWWKREGEVR